MAACCLNAGGWDMVPEAIVVAPSWEILLPGEE
jgi:hypothetical protein